MGAKLKLTTRGFTELEEAFKKLGNKVDGIIKKDMQAAADQFTSEIKAGAIARNLPKESLDAIIQPVVKQAGNEISCEAGFKLGDYGSGDGGGYIALYTEYGTPYRKKYGKQQPDPFIAPARDRATRAYKKNLSKDIKKALEDELK